MLVTVQQASEHLRLDTMDDVADLTLKIKAASRSVLNYLKDHMLAYIPVTDEHGNPVLDSAGDIEYEIDSAGDRIVREEVQSAVLLVLGNLYIDRDGDAFVKGDYTERLGNESLPKAVHWLLDPLRTPSMA